MFLPDNSHGLPPLFLIGIVVGQAEMVFQSIPDFIKVLVIVTGAASAFFSIKTDIAVIHSQMNYAAVERLEFKDFIKTGSSRCVGIDCLEIKKRISDLEGLHRK